MNPDRVWRELANDALANQIVAEHYELFVAMPFRDQFSYRSNRVFADVIEAAVAETRAAGLTRQFAKPIRADKLTPNASEITDDIVEAILIATSSWPTSHWRIRVSSSSWVWP